MSWKAFHGSDSKYTQGMVDTLKTLRNVSVFEDAGNCLSERNSTSSMEEFTMTKVPFILYLTLLALGIITGNTVVIVAVRKFHFLQQFRYILLVSLSVADLLQGTVTVPLYITWSVVPSLFQNETLCHVTLLSCLMVVTASILNLTVVTVNHYLAICYPLWHHRIISLKPHILPLVIALVWMISILTTGLSYFAMNTEFEDCIYYKVFDKTFLLVSVIAGALVPFACLAYSHLRIFLISRDLDMKFREQTLRIQGQTFLSPRNQCRRGSRHLLQTTKTIIIVVTCFLFAWLPFSALILVFTFCESCEPGHAMDVVLYLAFTNSVLNPIIYALCHSSFKTAYLKLFRCRLTPPSNR
ncbi:adenosine receptor A1-like [Haliotis cracherodii]|uniref:adenosine receptor A1-like n=1 Tax=Haliotis cracherodii TaxID=6455 RepID=UPI0039E7815A